MVAIESCRRNNINDNSVILWMCKWLLVPVISVCWHCADKCEQTGAPSQHIPIWERPLVDRPQTFQLNWETAAHCFTATTMNGWGNMVFLIWPHNFKKSLSCKSFLSHRLCLNGKDNFYAVNGDILIDSNLPFMIKWLFGEGFENSRQEAIF